MKRVFATAICLGSLSFSAQASSIEFIDNMVTGPKGQSSIVTLGKPSGCSDTACFDSTGGDPKMATATAQQQIALAITPVKKINMEFARRFTDPAVPVPATIDDGGAVNPVAATPQAPADIGTVAEQPPVQPEMTPQQMGAPDVTTRGTLDPNVPPMPVVSSELREGE